MEEKFTEADLVDFGNYLLSTERRSHIEFEENLDKVNDVDLANWKEKRK